MSAAEPCLDCGTTSGVVPPGRSRPRRTRGLCAACYLRHRYAGTLDQYDRANVEARAFLEAFLAGEVEPDASGCVRWPGATDRTGYAQVKHGGRIERVGRLVAEHRFGPPPSPEHSQRHAPHDVCGHRDCLEHVVGWATPEEQKADQRRDGTLPLGEGHHQAKLTRADALEARHRARCLGESHRAVAAAFGIGRATVGRIARGENWSHLEAEPCPHGCAQEVAA